MLFATGGTISMRSDPHAGGALPALSGREILDCELTKLGVRAAGISGCDGGTLVESTNS